MLRKALPVEGVYEREEGSGFWYARFKINGKLVRKSSAETVPPPSPTSRKPGSFGALAKESYRPPPSVPC